MQQGLAEACLPLRVEARLPPWDGRLVVLDEGLAEAALLVLREGPPRYVRVPSADLIIADVHRFYYKVGRRWVARSYDDPVAAVAMLYLSMILGLPPKRVTRLKRRIVETLLEPLLKAAQPSIVVGKGEPRVFVDLASARITMGSVILKPFHEREFRIIYMDKCTRVLVELECGEREIIACTVPDAKRAAELLSRYGIVASESIDRHTLRVRVEKAGQLASILRALEVEADGADGEVALRLLCSRSWSILTMRAAPQLLDSENDMTERLGSYWKLVNRMAYMGRLGNIAMASIPAPREDMEGYRYVHGYVYMPCRQLVYLQTIFRKILDPLLVGYVDESLVTRPSLPLVSWAYEVLDEALMAHPECIDLVVEGLDGVPREYREMLRAAASDPRVLLRLAGYAAYPEWCGNRRLVPLVAYEGVKIVEALAALLCCAGRGRSSD